MHNGLRDLGARDAVIFAEAFGPAALTRRPDKAATFEAEPEADSAVIKFGQSGHDQLWVKGDATLLETVEAHGITPLFSCRRGSSGRCLTK